MRTPLLFYTVQISNTVLYNFLIYYTIYPSYLRLHINTICYLNNRLCNCVVYGGINLDRRILKTREDIRNAFIVLLKEKVFEEITVKDIAEEANINRATFYKHYDDKHDLLAYLEEGIIEKIKHVIETSSPINLTLAWQDQPAFQTIVDIYHYINEERDLIEVLISSNGNQTFLTHMQFLLEQMLMNHFKQIKTTKQSTMTLELIVVYLASAHLGVIKHWLIKKLPYTPEEMAMMLIKILRDGPVTMITSISK